MSDGEGWEDELLALATDDPNKKASKKRRSSGSGKEPSSKRRKADRDVSDSDMDPESEEDDSNPYPLEGKYKDEEDRARLLGLPELEREAIIAKRMEEMQERYESQNLDSLLRAQNVTDGDAVSQAAKRKHGVRGATKEKTRKLDELKAKRKAKEDRARTRPERADSPTDRRRGSSSEPELSDVTDEERGADRDDEEDGKYLDKSKSNSPDKGGTLTFDALERLRVSRHAITKYFYHTWFPDWITGAWVRYLIGDDNGQPVYRICEVLGVVSNPVKPYKVNDITVDRLLELRHGKAIKSMPMDKISDGRFSRKEYERLVRVMETENVEFPVRRLYDRKVEQLRELPNKTLTEADITAMIARKSALNPTGVSAAQVFNTRVDLIQKRKLALSRHDHKEVVDIDRQIQELETAHPELVRREQPKDTQAELLARVNERNRKANLEQIRKAEMEAAMRKRQERKAAAARLNTPSGTPKLGSNNGPANRSVSPLPPLNGANGEKGNTRPANGSWEAKIIDSIEIDLGDF